MARIVIVNWAGKTLEASDSTKTLLQHLHEHRLDWMHACGGKGRCTTCKAIVVGGAEDLHALTAAETRYATMGALKTNERLACQLKVSTDITIKVPEVYKLPHIDYEK